MKKLSSEILRGVVGGAFLTRALEGVSSIFTIACFSSGSAALLYNMSIPVITVLVAAPISAAYLFSSKRKCVHWIAIIALLLAIIIPVAGLTMLLSNSHVTRQDIKISTASSSIVRMLWSILLLYFIMQIKRKETEA